MSTGPSSREAARMADERPPILVQFEHWILGDMFFGQTFKRYWWWLMAFEYFKRLLEYYSLASIATSLEISRQDFLRLDSVLCFISGDWENSERSSEARVGSIKSCLRKFSDCEKIVWQSNFKMTLCLEPTTHPIKGWVHTCPPFEYCPEYLEAGVGRHYTCMFTGTCTISSGSQLALLNIKTACFDHDADRIN